MDRRVDFGFAAFLSEKTFRRTWMKSRTHESNKY